MRPRIRVLRRWTIPLAVGIGVSVCGCWDPDTDAGSVGWLVVQKAGVQPASPELGVVAVASWSGGNAIGISTQAGTHRLADAVDTGGPSCIAGLKRQDQLYFVVVPKDSEVLVRVELYDTSATDAGTGVDARDTDGATEDPPGQTVLCPSLGAPVHVAVVPLARGATNSSTDDASVAEEDGATADQASEEAASEDAEKEPEVDGGADANADSPADDDANADANVPTDGEANDSPEGTEP